METFDGDGDDDDDDDDDGGETTYQGLYGFMFDSCFGNQESHRLSTVT